MVTSLRFPRVSALLHLGRGHQCHGQVVPSLDMLARMNISWYISTVTYRLQVQQQTGHFLFAYPLQLFGHFAPVCQLARSFKQWHLMCFFVNSGGDFRQQLPYFWTHRPRKTLFIGPPCCDLDHLLEVLPLHLLVFSIASRV